MDFFDELILEVAGFLKQNGFTKKGTTFLLKKDNIGVLNLQRSLSNTKEVCKFTINLGVYSPKLAKALPYDRETDAPDVWSCHWNRRIGDFLDERHDFWWTADSNSDKREIIQDVLDKIIDIAIPNIQSRISDEGLLNSWKTKNTGFEEIRNASTLMKILGYQDDLIKYIEEMKAMKGNKRFELLIKEHIDFLENSRTI
jgi:hypothetical protein